MVMACKYPAASGPINICSVTRRPAQFHRGGYHGFPREVLLAGWSSKGRGGGLAAGGTAGACCCLPARSPAPSRLPCCQPCASQSFSLPLKSVVVQGHCLVCSAIMYGDCKTARSAWQLVEILFLWLQRAKDTFEEIIGIIKLPYCNASHSFIPWMSKTISSINEQQQQKTIFSQIYQQKHRKCNVQAHSEAVVLQIVALGSWGGDRGTRWLRAGWHRVQGQLGKHDCL